MIHGITIQLLRRAQTGVDDYGSPVFDETAVTVPGVLVGEPVTSESPSTLDPIGRRVQYTMALPKGDSNEWEGNRVILPEPFAGTFRVIGLPTAGIEANIPLRWNKKVLIERWIFVGSEPEALQLLAESPQAHGVFDPPTETPRAVTATLRHIELEEGFAAASHKLRPVYVLVLDREADYRGEKICLYRGRRCNVQRAEVYAQYTELHIREATVDAGSA